MSTKTHPGWELCEAHGTTRRLRDLKPSRSVEEKREVDGEGGKRTLVNVTQFYICLDGCDFLFNKPKAPAPPPEVLELPPPNLPDCKSTPATELLAELASVSDPAPDQLPPPVERFLMEPMPDDVPIDAEEDEDDDDDVPPRWPHLAPRKVNGSH